VFNKDTTPNLEVWKAVRITCSFPLIFTPVLLNDNYYIDGGNTCNNTNYFSNKEETIGILLEKNDNIKFEINNFEDFIKNVLYTPLKSLKFSKYNSINCFEIETNSIKINCLDFTIKNKSKSYLYNYGYQEMLKQIEEVLTNMVKYKNLKKKESKTVSTQTE